MIAFDRCQKWEIYGFSSITCFNDPILLRCIWYLTLNRMHVQLVKGGYASIWPGAI